MNLSKLTLVIISLVLIIGISGAVFLKITESRNLTLVFNDRIAETKNTFEKTSELKSQSLRNLATDYTYWDDLVNFVANPDPDFAKDNLETSLSTYKADSVWVYNLEDKLVYSATVDNEVTEFAKELPLTVSDRLKIFQSEAIRHFYIKDSRGFLEIYAATIHPSNDAERKTPAKGYFYVGRYITGEVLTELGNATGTEVVALETSKVTNSNDKTESSSGSLTFYNQLSDQNNKVIGFLAVSDVFNSINQLSESSNQDFIILVILGSALGLAIVVIFYLNSRSLAHAENLANKITASLKESEEKYRLLAENSKEIVALLKADNIYEYVSPAVTIITGYSPNELIGKSSYDFIHPDDVSVVRNQSHAIAVIQKSASNLEYRFKKKDGSYIWLETISQPVLFRDGKVDKIQSSSRDISERKRDEVELAQQTDELAKLNSIMVNRELKMIELKKEISKLTKRSENKGGK